MQTRQFVEALRVLGYFAGDVSGPWSDAASPAPRAAQTALGVAVDGKWGPKTRALRSAFGSTFSELRPWTRRVSSASGW